LLWAQAESEGGGVWGPGVGEEPVRSAKPSLMAPREGKKKRLNAHAGPSSLAAEEEAHEPQEGGEGPEGEPEGRAPAQSCDTEAGAKHLRQAPLSRRARGALQDDLD